MSPLLDWIEATPLVQKISLVGLTTIFLGIGFYWLVAEPIMEETDKLEGEIQILDQQIASYSQSEKQYIKVKEKLAQWKAMVSRQEERLGLEVSMSQVLSDMSHMAQETGILLTLWKSDDQKPEASKPFKANHLLLHVEGGYHNVARFLEQVQYLSKTMGVVALSMHRASAVDGRPTIQGVMDLMGYEGTSQELAVHSQRFGNAPWNESKS